MAALIMAPRFSLTNPPARTATTIDLSKSYMVGDSVKDMVAAKQAHPDMQTVLVKTGKAGQDERLPHPPEAWQENIHTAVDWIIAKEDP